MNDQNIKPAPWTQAGWEDEVTTWIDGHVERTGELEVVKKWSISAVLKAPTKTGNVYFKEALDLPLFVHEPHLTDGLGRILPGHIPEVLALEEKRRWLLMADCGKVLESADEEVQHAVLQLYNRLQAKVVPRQDELFAIGCLDRRLQRLEKQMQPLLADPLTRAQLEEGQVEILEGQMPRFIDMARQLAALPIPQTLVHGDLHLGNVSRQAGQYIFFDWTDACVAHPFFDMLVAYGSGDIDKTWLYNTCLKPWRAWADEATLVQAWTLSVPLAYLHYAVTYQSLLSHLPAQLRHELEDDWDAMLKFLVQWCREN
ncbi:MAG: phosphotransferase [Candidatus Latescibacteria bacterium]|nr:phosphotransferase [Candidatus Latescibacterota bacterium]